MPRRLTVQQKNIIRQEIDMENIRCADDISEYNWNELLILNDYETLWQDANRFIYDYRMSKLK